MSTSRFLLRENLIIGFHTLDGDDCRCALHLPVRSDILPDLVQDMVVFLLNPILVPLQLLEGAVWIVQPIQQNL